ncbi:MAG: hypothetical protein SH809_13555 [Rhodothermales bacterium]|nr:hypothetical protein [Rhodothermales bacterium]
MIRASLLCAVIAAGMVAGCDSDINPVIGTDQPFTLYGVVSPQLDTQRVLVFPVEGQLRQLTDAPLDAVFSWTNTETGASSTWQDSLIRQPDGSFVHMYWWPGAADFGRRYDVRVANGAGVETQVTVRVPGESEIVIQSPSLASSTIVPVRVLGDVPNLLKLELEYGFDYTQASLGEKLESLVIPYNEQASRVADGWLIQVNLARDYRTVLDYIRSQRAIELAPGIQLRGIQIRFLAANEEWSPPAGGFDPEILVQPGTMDNVENGFGFVGAGYRVTHNWLPEESLANAAGFRQ